VNLEFCRQLSKNSLKKNTKDASTPNWTKETKTLSSFAEQTNVLKKTSEQRTKEQKA
jgi:hypothetical protein